MPFSRYIAAGFLIIFILLATLDSGQNIWFSNNTLWLTVLLISILFIMSFMGIFLLDLIIMLTEACFLQRIIILYFFPEVLFDNKYSGIYFQRDEFFQAILFLVYLHIGILIGTILSKRLYSKIENNSNDITIFNFNNLFNTFFHYYATIYIPLLLWHILMILWFGVGVTGIEMVVGWEIIYRLTTFIDSIWFVAIVAILTKETSGNNKKLAIIILLLIVLTNILGTSKGFFPVLAIMIVICCHCLNKNISNKIYLFGMVAVILIGIIWFNVMGNLRIAVLEYTSKGAIDFSLSDFFKESFLDNIFSVSLRLGQLDWLVSFISVGREAFPSYVSIIGDMKSIIDSFVPYDLVPGGIMGSKDNISIAKLIPSILKKWQLKSMVGHGENLGLFGMIYIYFGWEYSYIFILTWVFITFMVTSSQISSILKILYYQQVILVLYTGGSLITVIKHLYQGLIIYVGIYLIFIGLSNRAPLKGLEGIMALGKEDKQSGSQGLQVTQDK